MPRKSLLADDPDEAGQRNRNSKVIEDVGREPEYVASKVDGEKVRQAREGVDYSIKTEMKTQWKQPKRKLNP